MTYCEGRNEVSLLYSPILQCHSTAHTITLHCIASHRIASYCIASHHASPRLPPRCTALHRITLHRISSNHTEAWESITPTQGATPKRGSLSPHLFLLFLFYFVEEMFLY